jgi:hypothetical protein
LPINSGYRAGHPPGFARWCTPRRAATWRKRSLLAGLTPLRQEPLRSLHGRKGFGPEGKVIRCGVVGRGLIAPGFTT